MIKYLTMTIEKQKNIALIAHDGKKQDMLKWCMDNKAILQQARLPQNDCGDFRRTAGYGRSYASAGRADDP